MCVCTLGASEKVPGTLNAKVPGTFSEALGVRHPNFAGSIWEESTVRRLLLTSALLAVCGLALWAQDKVKDTPAAAATRKKLQAKVKVDYKEGKLKEVFDDLKDKIKEATGQEFSYALDTVGGVSQNISVNYKGEGTVEKVLDEMLGKMDMGYIVVAGEYKRYKGRYDGWVLIVKGKERGYPEGSGPAKDKATAKDGDDTKDKAPAKDKAVAKDKGDKDKTPAKDKASAKDKEDAKDKGGDDDKAEKEAANSLRLAKKLIAAGVKTKAIERLKELIKQYPKTKAAEEAKKLLETLK